MMSELEQFKEETAFRLFGRSRSLAIAGNGCVKCGESAVDFRDEISRKEFGISGFCQSCQDVVFGSLGADDEEKEEILDVIHPIMGDEPEVGQGSHAIPGFFVPPEALDGLEN